MATLFELALGFKFKL